MITNEHLTDIESAFTQNVLDEIFEQYVRARQKPSEATREALARVYGKTSDDIQRAFETFSAAPA